MTITEVLVATAISGILIASVAAAFIQIIRASDEAEASVRANNTGRSAVDKMAQELRMLLLDQDSDFHQFELTDRTLTRGDFIDNDGDGNFDEEVFDGLDDDGDWTSTDDRHMAISGGPERAPWQNVADYGDDAVDEDVRFSADEIRFVLPARAGVPRQMVRYFLGTFDGEENVLLRGVITNPEATAPYGNEVIEPVAFDVLSLDILAWNANDDAAGPVSGEPYWTSTWDATQQTVLTNKPLNAPNGTPPFKLPAAFMISVTVNAERQALGDIQNWQTSGRALKSVRMDSVVTVESVTQDIRYYLYLRN